MSKEQINIRAKDGSSISGFAAELDNKSIKAVVLVSYGFGEHSGMYFDFADRLGQAGYACVIPELRGHGAICEDPKKRKKLQGIIPGYESFLDDIESVTAYIQEITPGKPIALYGHSMGGNIAVNYLLSRGQKDYKCAALESPWFSLHKEINPLVAGFARVAGSISPGLAIVNKLNLSDVTGDSEKAEAIAKDPLYHNRISLRMFTGVKNGCAYALDDAPKLSIPTYLAFARNEAIVSNAAINKFAGACKEYVTAKEYESCHMIHNDVKREQFYKDLMLFFDEQCL